MDLVNLDRRIISCARFLDPSWPPGRDNNYNVPEILKFNHDVKHACEPGRITITKKVHRVLCDQNPGANGSIPRKLHQAG